MPKSAKSSEHFRGIKRSMHTYRHRRTSTCRPAPDELHWVIVNIILGISPEALWPGQYSRLPGSQATVKHNEKWCLQFVSSALYWESSASYYLPWLDLKVYLFRWVSFYRGALALVYREKDAILYMTVNLQGDLNCPAEVCFFSCDSISLRRCAEAGPPKGLFHVFVVLLS